MISQDLNEFFKNAVSILNINKNSFITNRTSDNVTDSIDKAIDKHKFHLSIPLIEQHLENHDIFHLKQLLFKTDW